jgi:PilZ domain
MRQEKRKKKRTHLIDYLEIIDNDSGSVIGHLADISPQGIMMVGHKPIALNKDFSFRLQLPASFTDSDVISFRAHSLWCKKDVNPEFYVSGFNFSEIADDEIKILTDLIKSYGFKSK